VIDLDDRISNVGGLRGMTNVRYYYDGICNLCGQKGRFESDDLRGARDQFACPSCRATLRYRNQAAAIISHFSDGNEVFFDLFMRSDRFKRLAVLEQGIRGPFARRLKGLPNYVQSYLFEDCPLGETRDGIVCQDLERLTFENDSFDLLVTSDVMEHVPDPRQVIGEVARILRPGGAHVFTIPIRWPIAPNSTPRAKIVDGRVEHLMEPSYHRSGLDEPSLTFTDFGADLLDWHAQAGMRAYFYDCHRTVGSLGRYPAVIAVKLA
jgi:SAM-dependent methyltransferase